MANSTINELNVLAYTDVAASDEIPIWDISAGVTKKVLVNYLGYGISVLNKTYDANNHVAIDLTSGAVQNYISFTVEDDNNTYEIGFVGDNAVGAALYSGVGNPTLGNEAHPWTKIWGSEIRTPLVKKYYNADNYVNVELTSGAAQNYIAIRVVDNANTYEVALDGDTGAFIQGAGDPTFGTSGNPWTAAYITTITSTTENITTANITTVNTSIVNKVYNANNYAKLDLTAGAVQNYLAIDVAQGGTLYEVALDGATGAFIKGTGNPSLGTAANRWVIYASTLNLSSTFTSATILPVTTTTYDLGSASYRWSTLYSSVVDAPIISKTHDGSNNVHIELTAGASQNYIAFSVEDGGTTYEIGLVGDYGALVSSTGSPTLGTAAIPWPAVYASAFYSGSNQGATGTITVASTTTITVKDGLITAWA